MHRLKRRDEPFNCERDYNYNQESRKEATYTCRRINIGITNDFFLSNRLRDLERDNGGGQQAHRFDNSLRRNAVQAVGEGCPPDARGYYDQQQCSAGKQRRHKGMGRRKQPQESLHWHVLTKRSPAHDPPRSSLPARSVKRVTRSGAFRVQMPLNFATALKTHPDALSIAFAAALNRFSTLIECGVGNRRLVR